MTNNRFRKRKGLPKWAETALKLDNNKGVEVSAATETGMIIIEQQDANFVHNAKESDRLAVSILSSSDEGLFLDDSYSASSFNNNIVNINRGEKEEEKGERGNDDQK